MNIYVMDTELQVIGNIDHYTSVIWTTRYYESGDFELYLPAGIKEVQLLKGNYYLCRDKDISKNVSGITYKNVMIIEKIEITTDIENGNYLIVTGRSLKSILRRRIIWRQTNLNGKVETEIYKLIRENAIDPVLPKRKIERLILAEPAGMKESMEAQITGDNLGETIEKMCMTYGYGYEIDIRDGQFVFYLYKGEDRSYRQMENPYVVFSYQFENLLKTDYFYDMQNFKNAALVAGEGEGLERKTKMVGSGADLERFELYVDARDISTNNGEYTEEEYNNMLWNRGMEHLKENSVVESFSGETETRMTYQLNKDYFLGDIVQVENEYGIEASTCILEIIESDNEAGNSIIPTFSALEV